LNRADVEDGVKPGVTQMDFDELRAAKKRIRLLEHEDEVLRRAAAYLSQGRSQNSFPAGLQTPVSRSAPMQNTAFQ
jgi:hypothetical protein